MNWIQYIKAAALCSGFMLISFIAKGQNLVPNGDFETYSACPFATINGSPIDLAVPWTSVTSVGNGTYFNRCDTVDNISSVPFTNGGTGYQQPHSGNGYAGFHFKFSINYRQYAEVKLIDTLKAGHCYFISFYVNLQNFDEIGCNNIAAHLSDTFLYTDNTTGLINASQDVVAYGNPVAMDTLGWFRSAGIYTAHGGEQYITIGNFMDDVHTDTLHQNTYDGNTFSSYAIDDVSMEEVNAQTPKAFAGNDTAINQGDSVFIGTLINGLSTQWYDGGGNAVAANIPGIWVHPTQSKDYILQQTVCGFTTTDTVHIDVWPTRIETIQGNSAIQVFPNPTTGVVNISLPSEGNWSMLVTDIQGRPIPVEQVNALPILTTLKVNAAAGIYMVRIANNTTGEVIIRKLTLQH